MIIILIIMMITTTTTLINTGNTHAILTLGLSFKLIITMALILVKQMFP